MHWVKYGLSVGLNSIIQQLLVSTRITQEDCKRWSRELLADKQVTDIISPLIYKWLTDSESTGVSAFKNYKGQILASAIITYSATIEFYFRDLLKYCHSNNIGLRKSSFTLKTDDFNANEHFNPIDLFDHRLIGNAQAKVILSICSTFSKGKNFTTKLKKVKRVLDIDIDKIPKQTKDSIDSIYRLRNKIAHSSIDKVVWSFTSPSGNEIRYSWLNEETYKPFVIELVRIIDQTVTLLEALADEAENKYPEDDKLYDIYFPSDEE